MADADADLATAVPEAAALRPRIGTAGWSVPTPLAADFPAEGTHLQRYAARFSAVEIDTSFYRPHRRSTYERWAASVPDDFRFAVKLPKTITHERRFKDCDDLARRFADEIGGLGPKCGPVLVQLPPSFAYPGLAVGAALESLRAVLQTDLVLEPRHASWFTDDVAAMLARRHVARVAADPARLPAAAEPGGWPGLVYIRLHGSPEIYVSDYPPERIAEHAAWLRRLRAAGKPTWLIYDNTAKGAAAANARDLLAGMA